MLVRMSMKETSSLLVENTYQKSAAMRASITTICSSMRRIFREVRLLSFCLPWFSVIVKVLEHPHGELNGLCRKKETVFYGLTHSALGL
jgi:hypothetical protein